MAFVKINCAFRDLRRDLQELRSTQTGDETHKRYFEKVNLLIDSIQDKINKLDKANIAVTKPFQDQQKRKIGKLTQDVSKLDKNIERLISIFQVILVESNIEMENHYSNYINSDKNL